MQVLAVTNWTAAMKAELKAEAEEAARLSAMLKAQAQQAARLKAETLEHALRRLHHRKMAAAFSTWHAVAEEATEHKRKASGALTRILNRLLSTAFETWQSKSADASVTRKGLVRLTQTKLAASFGTWLAAAEEAAWHEYKVSGALTRMKAKPLSAAFETWKASTAAAQAATLLQSAVDKAGAVLGTINQCSLLCSDPLVKDALHNWIDASMAHALLYGSPTTAMNESASPSDAEPQHELDLAGGSILAALRTALLSPQSKLQHRWSRCLCVVADSIVAADSTDAADSTVAAVSTDAADITVAADSTVAADITVAADSTDAADSTLVTFLPSVSIATNIENKFCCC